MAGSEEGAAGSLPRDPKARMPRDVAVRLLGELDIDERYPYWGEHRAWCAGVPGARCHYSELPAKFGRPEDVEWQHESLVAARGQQLLAELLAG